MSAWERAITPPLAPTLAAIDAWYQQQSDRKKMQMNISGEFGPAAMTGVQSYPYTPSQRLYRKDFQALVAGTIDHPYLTTASSVGSTPFNIMTGSGYDGERLQGSRAQKWNSEASAQFVPRSYAAAKATSTFGIRSEQVQFVS